MGGKKKFNILIFSWRGPGHPNAGGAEISSHEHAKAWVKVGHSVTLFTSLYKGAKREEMIDGIFVKREGGQFLQVQWEAFKWYAFASHLKFDLVVDEFHGIPFFTPLYVKAKKLGFIHEVAKEVWGLNQFPIPFVGNIGAIAEPLIFQLYKNIPFMTVSESTKKDLTHWGIPSNNITVINNGITRMRFKKIPPKEEKKTIIYLGALAKDKGIERGLQIFSLLNPNWQFWVVGKSDPEYLKKLKEISARLKLTGNIKFWGYVNQQRKYELLVRAHLLLHPSIREGWGLVVIEAASVGTPTVAFDAPGLRDSILNGQTGILCDDAVQMVSEIERLINDEGRLYKLSKNAISWSKNFSWDKASRASLNLIEKLVDY